MPVTSTGRAHVSRGFEGSSADYVAHVCFDSYFGSPCIFFYTPERAVECASRKQGVYGSRAGSTQKNTGFGAKVTPTELNARREDFTPDPGLLNEELGERGKEEAKRFYREHGWTVRDATKKEDIREKFDFEATKSGRALKIEVKSRGSDRGFPQLFVQTHEANPDKRVK